MASGSLLLLHRWQRLLYRRFGARPTSYDRSAQMKRFLDPIPYILVTAAFVAVVALAITYKPPVHKVDIVSAGTVVRVTAMPGAFNAPDVTQLETDKYILILRGYHSARVGQNAW